MAQEKSDSSDNSARIEQNCEEILQVESVPSQDNDESNKTDDNRKGKTAKATISTSATASPNTSRVVSLEKQGNGYDCTICLQKVIHKELGLLEPCQHTFHTACVTKWIENRSSCPNCRQTANELAFNFTIGANGEETCERQAIEEKDDDEEEVHMVVLTPGVRVFSRAPLPLYDVVADIEGVFMVRTNEETATPIEIGTAVRLQNVNGIVIRVGNESLPLATAIEELRAGQSEELNSLQDILGHIANLAGGLGLSTGANESDNEEAESGESSSSDHDEVDEGSPQEIELGQDGEGLVGLQQVLQQIADVANQFGLIVSPATSDSEENDSDDEHVLEIPILIPSNDREEEQVEALVSPPEEELDTSCSSSSEEEEEEEPPTRRIRNNATTRATERRPAKRTIAPRRSTNARTRRAAPSARTAPRRRLNNLPRQRAPRRRRTNRSSPNDQVQLRRSARRRDSSDEDAPPAKRRRM